MKRTALLAILSVATVLGTGAAAAEVSDTLKLLKRSRLSRNRASLLALELLPFLD